MESKDLDAIQASKVPSDIDSIDSTDKSSDPQPMLEPAEISSTQSLKEDNAVSSTVDEDKVDGKRLPADDCSAQDLEKDNLTQSAGLDTFLSLRHYISMYAKEVCYGLSQSTKLLS